MSFLLKETIHESLAQTLYNEIVTRKSTYHYFIGRNLEWDTPSVPETPVATHQYEYTTRNNIIATKRINPTDVSFVIRRINWLSGEVYDQYDPDYSASNLASSGASSLKDAEFYVMTTSYNVYKCLFNSGGVASTEEPQGTDPLPINYADGYMWKYMFTVPLSSRNKFLTADYIPVNTSVNNSFFSDGQVETVVVVNAGSGYLGNAEVTMSVLGTFAAGNGNVVASVTPVFNDAGQIVDVRITNPGNNYTSANVSIVDLNGSGESYYKSVKAVYVTNIGAGYVANVVSNTTATVVTSGVHQPTDTALVELLYQNNTAVGIKLTNKGTGYNSNVIANTSVVIATTGNSQPTTNATSNISFVTDAIVTPVLLDGVVDRVLIEDPGIGYSSNIQTTIVLAGDGTGAVLLPFVNGAGEVEDVIIENRGNGYTYLNLTVVGDGTGASLSVNLATSDLNSTQSTVELSALDGAIYAVRVANAGVGYNTTANINIVGDGINFSGIVHRSNANTISYIEVSNPGSGYTFATANISNPYGSNAVLYPIFSPFGGHGKNAVKELFADTLMLYSTINEDTIHGKPINNDYRQFGIIKDPLNFSADTKHGNVLGTPCYLVTVSSLGTLTTDDILSIENDIYEFGVIEVIPATNQLVLTNLNNYNLDAGTLLYDAATDTTCVVYAVDGMPDINKLSGDMLYMDNRTSVAYNENQLVTLRTVIKF